MLTSILRIAQQASLYLIWQDVVQNVTRQERTFSGWLSKCCWVVKSTAALKSAPYWGGEKGAGILFI